MKWHQAGQQVADLPREVGVSEATIYVWKSKYGGLEVSEAHRLRQLEEENRRLQHLMADLSLDKEVLKAVSQKKSMVRRWFASASLMSNESAQIYPACVWA